MQYTFLLLFIFSQFSKAASQSQNSSSVASKDCKTPLGKDSKCVSVLDCPELLSTIQNRTLSKEDEWFIKLSVCGITQQNIPEVCCGPLPTPQVYPTVLQEDTTVANDSYLAPRDQCGIDTQGDKIYGGNATELDEYPWMAMLGYMNSTVWKLTYQCGGMILNNRYVLTAAHCLTGPAIVKYGKLLTVRLGEYDTRTDMDCMDGACANLPQEIPVLASYVHEGYTELNFEDDIGLIRLARRAMYSYFVQPICLVKAGIHLDTGTDVVVVGWGETLSGERSPVKIKLHMPIFNKTVCDSIFEEANMNLTHKHLCAGGVAAEDACIGDSGGPLMISRPKGIWEAVGIVSNGMKCGLEGVPGVYTSITHYLDWIKSTMISTNK